MQETRDEVHPLLSWEKGAGRMRLRKLEKESGNEEKNYLKWIRKRVSSRNHHSPFILKLKIKIL